MALVTQPTVAPTSRPLISRFTGLVRRHRGFLLAVTAIVVTRLWLITPYTSEQTSMSPGYPPGSYLLVERLPANLLAYAPGQIVVARAPAWLGPRAEHILKRIVAIGPARVDLRAGRVWVNGHRLAEPYLVPGTLTDSRGTIRWYLAPGEVFLLGDHRAASVDSRTFGPLPLDQLEGQILLGFPAAP
jgi:signal peptidase I